MRSFMSPKNKIEICHVFYVIYWRLSAYQYLRPEELLGSAENSVGWSGEPGLTRHHWYVGGFILSQLLLGVDLVDLVDLQLVWRSLFLWNCHSDIAFGNQTWLAGKSTPRGYLNQKSIGAWLGMFGGLILAHRIGIGCSNWIEKEVI